MKQNNYLIACSGSKIDVNNIVNVKSTLENLKGFPSLYNERKELIDILNVKLNWDKTVPAYQLYKGRIYLRMADENWKKGFENVIIVSALFGLLRPDDLIPNYDLEMNFKLPNGEKVSDFWRNKGISKFINNNDIDLLLKNYKRAFSKNSLSIASEPSIVWRDKYGFHKGEWLNAELSKL